MLYTQNEEHLELILHGSLSPYAGVLGITTAGRSIFVVIFVLFSIFTIYRVVFLNCIYGFLAHEFVVNQFL